MTGLLGQDEKSSRLAISPLALQTMREFGAYQYPEQKFGKNAGEKPMDADNHCLDALRYAVKGVAGGDTGLLQMMRRRLGRLTRDVETPPERRIITSRRVGY